MGKSYCPGWSQTVDEGNFWAKTPAYLCGNQPVSQVLAISAPRPSERPKLGHDPREIHSTVSREQHLTQTTRDPELKHKLNFACHTDLDHMRSAVWTAWSEAVQPASTPLVVCCLSQDLVRYGTPQRKAPWVPHNNSTAKPSPAISCRPEARAYKKTCIQPFRAFPSADVDRQ